MDKDCFIRFCCLNLWGYCPAQNLGCFRELQQKSCGFSIFIYPENQTVHMFKKLFLIIFIVLINSSLQSQFRSPLAGSGDPGLITTAVNRADVIIYAKKYLGTIYHYAGSDPAIGFDCSGFVSFVFKNFDIDLPRGSREYKLLGISLKPEEFRVGDVLVFYGYKDHNRIGHVGIICEADGMKSRFIHSSSGKAYGVTISELGSEMYTRRFYKCIDVIDELK